MGRDRHPLGGRLLVEPGGRVDRRHQIPGGLQPGHLGVGLGPCRGSLGHEVPQGARLHALLPEAGQDVGDVAQVGLVRTDEEHAAPAVTETGVGVEQVGGAVQGDDRLARARTPVDDESAAGPRADDGVLVGLDGAEYVPHPGRPVAAQAGDEGGLVVERGVPGEPLRGEHLVPVVADPAAGPAVSAAAGQPHRVGVGGSEERLGRGERQSMSSRRPELSVRPSRPMYRGSGSSSATMCPRHRSRPKRRSARRRAVSRWISTSRSIACSTRTAGCPALGGEALGQLGDRFVEALRDGREVLFVAA